MNNLELRGAFCVLRNAKVALDRRSKVTRTKKVIYEETRMEPNVAGGKANDLVEGNYSW